MNWQSLLPQLLLRQTVQSCICGELMGTCVDLTNSKLNLVFNARRRKCPPVDHLGSRYVYRKLKACQNNKIIFKNICYIQSYFETFFLNVTNDVV